jgi:hypothetical protein
MKRLILISGNFCMLILMVLWAMTTSAQQVVSTSGNHAENGSAQMSWTVGEIITTTISGGSNILTQGFHQSRLTVTAIEEAEVPDFEISAFPNPAFECVNLSFYDLPEQQSGGLWKNFYFQLFDVNGKLLLQKKIESTETVISMDSYAPSTYFLKVCAVRTNNRTGNTGKNREADRVKSGDARAKSFSVVKTFTIIKQ